jgi:hypothetical protein
MNAATAIATANSSRRWTQSAGWRRRYADRSVCRTELPSTTSPDEQNSNCNRNNKSNNGGDLNR